MDQIDLSPEGAAKRARESRIAQGLPPKVTDPVVLKQIAELMRATGGTARDRSERA